MIIENEIFAIIKIKKWYPIFKSNNYFIYCQASRLLYSEGIKVYPTK